MENLLSLQPSKISAASRFAGKRVQAQEAKYRPVPLDKSTFLGPILITVLFLAIFIIFDFSYAQQGDHKNPPEAKATELEEKVKELSDRVDMLQAATKPKMIRPNKEVEFLFDSVVGFSYSPEDDRADFKFQNHPILKLWAPRFRLITRATYKTPLVNNLPRIDSRLIENAKIQAKEKPYIVDYVRKQLHELSKKSDLFKKSQAEDIVKSFKELLLEEERSLCPKIVNDCLTEATRKVCDNCGIEKEVELSDSQATEYKMLAVEKVLGLESKGKKIIERIDSAHTEIRNYEWKHDYLRFGILVNYIPGIQANATSIVLSAYPSYRRFMPGNLDLGRRISFFFAGGTASTEGETEAKGIVYSYGFGVDVIRGVGLAIGMSTYRFREVATEDYKTKNSFSLGISLNSELWKGLFGK